ncbi:Hypothetical_protein [Hexamita inflata]|uniref:Hypothetical_protein n=1 Tax=Hexamita inflata TaxID=28002 RepID=A0AA86TDJ0_9EUKA|nr:Hypothetical protein HINF_LOCUS3284 [Hexamita inflata]
MHLKIKPVLENYIFLIIIFIYPTHLTFVYTSSVFSIYDLTPIKNIVKKEKCELKDSFGNVVNGVFHPVRNYAYEYLNKNYVDGQYRLNENQQKYQDKYLAYINSKKKKKHFQITKTSIDSQSQQQSACFKVIGNHLAQLFQPHEPSCGFVEEYGKFQ